MGRTDTQNAACDGIDPKAIAIKAWGHNGVHSNVVGDGNLDVSRPSSARKRLRDGISLLLQSRLDFADRFIITVTFRDF
jgi:hypothetical protein